MNKKINIDYDKLSKFRLDSQNPRLGREAHKKGLSQDEILDLMKDWSLEELASSFLENGFWPHEAILCIEEGDYLIVIEGNRRLAALKFLRNTVEGNSPSKKWKNLIADAEIPSDLFEKIPYIKLENRNEIDAFLGFRHVTGIKEWKPAEKAEYITYLINERKMTYVDVMRNIGSKTETVRRNYIAFSLLLQMEDTEGINVKKVEERFSVLFLSLRTPGVQKFLGIDINAEPDDARTPVDEDHLNSLREFTHWLFGDEEKEAIVTDSRQVDEFAKILTSKEALAYLRKATSPSLNKAYILAGGQLEELIEILERAAYDISDSLSFIYLYKESEDLQKIVERLLEAAKQLEILYTQKADDAANPST